MLPGEEDVSINDLESEEDAIINDVVSDFNLDVYDENPTSYSATTNEYIKNLLKLSNLHVTQEGKVRKAYNDSKEVGLFHLFFTQQYLEIICQWTNILFQIAYSFQASMIVR